MKKMARKYKLPFIRKINIKAIMCNMIATVNIAICIYM